MAPSIEQILFVFGVSYLSSDLDILLARPLDPLPIITAASVAHHCTHSNAIPMKTSAGARVLGTAASNSRVSQARLMGGRALTANC